MGSRDFVLGTKPATDSASRYGIAISIALHLALLIVFALLLSSEPTEMRRPPTRMIRAELIAPVARQALRELMLDTGKTTSSKSPRQTGRASQAQSVAKAISTSRRSPSPL